MGGFGMGGMGMAMGMGMGGGDMGGIRQNAMQGMGRMLMLGAGGEDDGELDLKDGEASVSHGAFGGSGAKVVPAMLDEPVELKEGQSVLCSDARWAQNGDYVEAFLGTNAGTTVMLTISNQGRGSIKTEFRQTSGPGFTRLPPRESSAAVLFASWDGGCGVAIDLA